MRIPPASGNSGAGPGSAQGETQGPNDFSITGNHRNGGRWTNLTRIATPTLEMGARYDEMDPEQIRRKGRLIPHARTRISARGSCLSMYDDQEAYFAAFVPFRRGRT